MPTARSKSAKRATIPARKASGGLKRPAARASPSSPGSNTPIHADILAYHASQTVADKRICDALAVAIHRALTANGAIGVENKVWHRHPVWFLDGNPVVGYHKLKDCVRLLFWSGQSFDEPGLVPEGTFKAAEARYTSAAQISKTDLERWLAKSIAIQWDYKNIVKRKGRLERLK